MDSSLTTWAQEEGLPAFRVRQIRTWIYKNRAGDFSEMSNLPKALREKVSKHFSIWTSQITKHEKAADGTEKLLLTLAGGGQIECVLLRDEVRRTVCVSTQVGCGMGCVFCASGLDGVERNLTTGEILEQILLCQRLLEPKERLSHLVVMGMGEPLANLDNLLPALHEVNSDEGFGIGARRITISTVGLPKAIRRLTDECTRYRLAVSLHAPSNELRDQIVPTNTKHAGLDEIMAEADRYFEQSGRQLTFEYVLLGGINDQAEHARALGLLLKDREAMLNVIPYNPVAGLPYKTPSIQTQHKFKEILENYGLTIRFRHKKGDEINAACGQLRRSQSTETSEAFVSSESLLPPPEK